MIFRVFFVEWLWEKKMTWLAPKQAFEAAFGSIDRCEQDFKKHLQVGHIKQAEQE
jgi:hypothetical protein